MNKIIILTMFLSVFCISSLNAQYSQRAAVFSAGGEKSETNSYTNYSSIGQFAASTSTNTYTISEGFMYSQMKTPPVQAKNLIFTNISRTGMTVSWTRGNLDACVLLGRQSSPIPAYPLTNGEVYTANSVYSSAPTVSYSKVLYNGTGSSVRVSGLTRYKLYYFKVFEYLDEQSPIYLLSNASGNPRTRWTLRRDGLMEEDLSIDIEYPYPNPVSTTVSTTMDLFEAGNVQAVIYSSDGKMVKELYNKNLEFGSYDLTFDLSDVSSGIYQLIITKGSEAIMYPLSVVR